MSEHEIQQRILLSLGNGDTRVWRNNVALGWVGQAQQIRQPTTVTLRPGDVVIRNGRPLHAGLCPGSSDIIGIHSVEVTPAMVGRRVGLFTAIEVKSQRGRANKVAHKVGENDRWCMPSIEQHLQRRRERAP